jgi:2-oxoisovalerate dehydrogenase E2 component (dihydrolipoyl transacylase)
MVPVRGPLVEFEVEGAGNADESPSVSPLRSEPPPPASRGEETAVAALSPPHASGEGDRAKRGGGALDAAVEAPTSGNYVFKLPDVGEGTAEAELVGWHVKVGDAVEEDQIIADIMTDKATVEITSPVAGTVVALYGEAGKSVPVGGPLVAFDVEGRGNVSTPVAAPKPASKPTENATTASAAISTAQSATSATKTSRDARKSVPALTGRAAGERPWPRRPCAIARAIWASI